MRAGHLETRAISSRGLAPSMNAKLAFTATSSAKAWSRWQRSQRQNGPQPSINRFFISSGEGRWSDEKFLAKVRELVLPKLERRGPIEAWIIDDTSFPKIGQHSLGVARQYCGELGKQDKLRTDNRAGSLEALKAEFEACWKRWKVSA